MSAGISLSVPHVVIDYMIHKAHDGFAGDMSYNTTDFVPLDEGIIMMNANTTLYMLLELHKPPDFILTR